MLVKLLRDWDDGLAKHSAGEYLHFTVGTDTTTSRLIDAGVAVVVDFISEFVQFPDTTQLGKSYTSYTATTLKDFVGAQLSKNYPGRASG